MDALFAALYQENLIVWPRVLRVTWCGNRCGSGDDNCSSSYISNRRDQQANGAKATGLCRSEVRPLQAENGEPQAAHVGQSPPTNREIRSSQYYCVPGGSLCRIMAGLATSSPSVDLSPAALAQRNPTRRTSDQPCGRPNGTLGARRPISENSNACRIRQSAYGGLRICRSLRSSSHLSNWDNTIQWCVPHGAAGRPDTKKTPR
jgi:hypothetical protein